MVGAWVGVTLIVVIKVEALNINKQRNYRGTDGGIKIEFYSF